MLFVLCVPSVWKTETSAIDHRTVKLVYTPISLEELTLREEQAPAVILLAHSINGEADVPSLRKIPSSLASCILHRKRSNPTYPLAEKKYG